MNCWFCGHKLIWEGDYSLEDFGGEGEGIVATLHCPNCNADVYCVLNCEDEENE